MILKNHKLGRSGQFMVSRALCCAWDHSLAEALSRQRLPSKATVARGNIQARQRLLEERLSASTHEARAHLQRDACELRRAREGLGFMPLTPQIANR